MPTTTSQMNGGSRSKLPVFHSSLTSSSSPSNLKRTNDELRQHISRLKAELEIEKAKSKQIHRDKVADIKRLKDEFDKEKIVAHGSVLDKLKNEHEVEIKKLKDSLQKEKEVEIKQILKFKDEELRTTKKILQEDKDFSLREQEEKLKRGFVINKTNNDIEIKLRQELNECRKQKQQFEDLCKQKSAAELEKSELIRQLKDEHEKENQRVLRDARIQIARNVHELKNAQRALAEKEQEMIKRELELTRLEEQKEYLSDKIRADVKRNSEHGENGMIRSEKEKELQLKNLELRKTLDDITRKNHILEKEASLKRADSKDSEPSSRAEVRVKELKKRNGELVTLAKKLEEKAKRLQEELRDLKSRDSATRSNGNESNASPRAFENFKKSFTMQRAKDLAENARATMTKDKEIVQLKEKISDLEEQLKNNDEDASEVQKLQMIIHQIEKEKLKLEKQFAADIAEAKKSMSVDHSQERALRNDLEDLQQQNEQLQKANAIEAEEIKELQEKIERVQEKGEQCDSLVLQLNERNQEYEQLVEDLELRENECKELKESIEKAEKEIKKRETEREKDHIMLKNLHNKMADMSQRLVEMGDVENECRNLQERLSDAEKHCNLMTDQLETLQDKVSDFKSLEQDLKDCEEKCKKWERDYDFAVEEINKRNKEIGNLHETQLESKMSHDQEVDDLREEISRLEEICVDLEGKENEYKELLEAQASKPSQFNHVYVQTSRQHTPVSSQRDVIMEDIVADIERVTEADIGLEVFEDPGLQDHEKTDDLSLIESELEVSSKCEDDILDIASSRIAALAAMSSSEGELSREDPLDLDKYIQKSEEIMEDQPTNNQDKVHENQGKLEKDKFQFDDGDTSDELSLSLDEMESDDDDVIDAKVPPSNNNIVRAKPHHGLQSKPREHRENQSTNKAHPTAVKRLNFKDKQDSDSSIFGPITPQGSVDEMSRDTIKQSSIDESVGDSVSSRVDKLSVFIAKYTYDPFEHSPNDDPSLELSLEAGDYVYIFGEVDEDGFYTGELVNGQRGLVPSNFIEKIADENELIPISTGHDGYPGDESDEDLTEAEYLKSTPRPSSSQNINDVFNGQSENEDDITKVKGLPPPRKLKMERQLNNSIVISWLPPADIDEGEVVGYSIKADGEVKETVIGVNRTRAIVSDIHHDKVYRISVQCFDKQEQESPGSVATITIGRGASAVPSDLKIQNLSPTSADLEWACGNSSMLHAIYLDGREVHVVKPGIDKFKLTDLVPDHEYEVNVEARQSKDAHKKSNIRPATSRSLLFTTPKGGPPDPPLNVQAQVRRKSASHRQTSILISWLPVTITDIGTSNGAIVQGYKIYMNDNEAAIVDLPTSDHVDILANNLHEILTDSKVDVIELWVKTQSSLGESMISNVVVLKMDRHLSDEIYRGGKKAKDSEKQLGLERKLSTGDLKLPKEVDTFEKKPNLERKLSTEKAAKISKNLETQPAEVIEPAYASVSVLEVEATQTDPTGAGTFDLNRKDSDLDRKLNWIDQLAAAEEGKGRDVASKKKENESEVSKLEAQKEARKDELTKKATVIRYDVVDSDDSGSSDESDSDDEVPRVYNIMKEEEEETGRKASAKTESPTQDNSSKSSDAVPQENLILPTIPMPDYPDKSEDSQEGPEISLPDYPDAIEVKPRTNFPLDDLLSDSDSNSELSAIEEETIDELLAYNKDGSRCVSPGKIRKSASLDRARSGLSPDTADKTYSIHSDNGNKTYSLHSDEEKNRTFDLEEKARVSDRKSSRTSKDTLTFSSDDVMDILDKDMIGTVPELPLDEEKNRKEADEKSKKKGKIDNEGNEKRNGTRVRDEKPSVETSKKPQTPEDSLKVSGKTLDSTKKKKIPEKSPEHETKTANQNRSSGKVDTVWTETGTVTADKGELLPEPAPLSPKTRALSAKTHAQNVIESDELPPAKQSPVATKDQPCVDARPELRKWAQKPTGLAQNELDFAAGEEEIIAKVEQLLEPVRFEERSAEDTDSPHELLHAKSSTADANLEAGNAKGGADSKNQPLDDTESNIGENLLPEAHRDWKQTQELQYNETPAVTDNGSGFASNLAPERQMGQANVSGYNDSDIDVELQELDDESSIKIPLTSVHDLYTLNAVDSFDDSALESESDYKPYFTPIGVHENAEKEAVEANKTTEFGMGSVDNTNRTAESNFNDNSTSYLSMGPVIDDKSITETPIYKDIDSVEPVAHSQGDNEKDNNMNENNEISNADTRINHVEADTQSNNVRVFVALFSYDPITMSPNTEGVDEELTFNEGDLIKIFGDCDEDGFYYGELHDKRGFVPSNMVQEISLGDFGNSFNIPPPPEDLSGDTEENISQENFEHKSGSRKQSITTEGSPKDSQPQSKESSKSKGPRNEPGRSTDNTSEEQPQSKRISKRKGSKKEPCRSADKNNEGSVEERRNNNPKMEEIATELENMDLDERSRDYRYISERDSIYCLPPRRMIAMYDYDPAVSSPNVDSEVELAFNKGDIIVIFGDMDEDGFFAAQSESERGLVPSNFLEECPEPSDSEEIEINMGAASPSIKSLSRKSSGASITGASPVDSPKSKKKKSFFSKSKKIFSKLKGK